MTKNPNYDALFSEIISNNKDSRVLLHCCCAPCASHSLFRLEGINTSAYFYNPSIMPFAEFNLRSQNMQKLCKELGIEYIQADYDNHKFLELVQGKENLPEGGQRCQLCFYDRLHHTASYALDNGYDFFCTTLTLSPYKDSKLINKIGYQISEETGLPYLPSDFKKQGGYQHSIKLSKELGLYRQNYCGCKFSNQNQN